MSAGDLARAMKRPSGTDRTIAAGGHGPLQAGAADRWRAAAHITALWVFAVAQPLLDLVGREPDFLIAQRLPGAPVLALALLLAVALPALLAAPLLVPAVGASLIGRLWANGIRTLLAAAFLLQLLHWLPGPAVLPLGAAAAAAVAAIFWLNRSRLLSSVVALAAAAALASPLVFLLRPGVRGLLVTDRTSGFEPDAVIADAASFTSDVPIVLVVFDELPTSSLQRPDGSIDAARFPSFAGLADDAAWYRRAVTVAMQTTRAIPAILTGQLPEREWRAFYGDHPSNLFTWLAVKGGYQVVAQETVSQLCPPSVCTDQPLRPLLKRLTSTAGDLGVVYGHVLLPPRLRSHLPPVDHAWTGFRRSAPGRAEDQGRAPDGDLHQNVPHLVDDFLRRVEDDGRGPPTFYYLHLNLPHRPWKYLPSGREYAPVGASAIPPGFDQPRLVENEQLILQGLQRHLLQVGYADRVLGQLLDRLKEVDIYDRAMIVVVADHGHSFRPGQHRRVATATTVEDVLEVPLFVKHPRQGDGAIFDHVVQTVDIAPTIAESVGAELPWRIDGKPVSDPVQRTVSACCFAAEDATRDFSTDPKRRQETLDRLGRLFGTGDDGDGPDHDPFARIFTAGPRPELLGRPVGHFAAEAPTVAGGEPNRVILAGSHAYHDVDPETGFVPSLVNGRIEPGLPEGTHLAVSVNGVVRATTRTFTHLGVSRFSTLVPDQWLPTGSHRIGIYTIGRDASAENAENTRLRPLAGINQPARLVLEGRRVQGIDLPGEGLLKRVDGLFQARLEVLEGGIRGHLIHQPGVEPFQVDEFFLFDGQHLLFRGEDDQFLRRLENRPGGEVHMTFRISLPAATAVDRQSLRLLVRTGDEVQELRLFPTPPGNYELVRNTQSRVVELLRRSRSDPDEEPERFRVEVRHGELIGHLDGRDRNGQGFLGWATDLAHPNSTQEVVAFLGDRQIWVGETGGPRPDVGLRHGAAHRQSGFLLPATALTEDDKSSGQDVAHLATIRDEGLVAFAVSRRGLATRLRFAYRPLTQREGGTDILPVSDGRELVVRPPGGGFAGAVDRIARPGLQTVIEGWAADVERGERPRQVVVYRDGEYLVTLAAGHERRDIVDHHDDPRLLRTGFRGRIPGAPEPETFRDQHRVFAVMLRGAAVELPILPQPPAPP